MYRNLELTLWIGLMLGASYTDLRHRMVPDWLNLCIAACSLLEMCIRDSRKTFRDILWNSGISYGGRNVGPRLHDLRHTFAVHSLQDVYKRQEEYR